MLDPDGPLRARVARAVPLEDGARLELELEHGRLYTVAPMPAPRPGETVRVHVRGGARFPAPEMPPVELPPAGSGSGSVTGRRGHG